MFLFTTMCVWLNSSFTCLMDFILYLIKDGICIDFIDDNNTSFDQ